MIQFITFDIDADELGMAPLKLFPRLVELPVSVMSCPVQFLLRFQISRSRFCEAGVHIEFGFRRNVFDGDIPSSGPQLRVEAGWHRWQTDAICILNIFFQEETLEFWEEVLATVAIAVDTWDQLCQIVGRNGSRRYKLRHPKDSPISRMLGAQRGRLSVRSLLDLSSSLARRA